jgi:hypothetical protein
MASPGRKILLVKTLRRNEVVPLSIPNTVSSVRIATLVGAAGSVGAMLRVGYRDDAAIPTLLLVLFTGWVVSPFLAMLAADRVSSRWAAPTRTMLHRLMLLVPLASLVIYGYVALSPPGPRPAAKFLMVPLGSWLVLAIALTMARASPGSRRSAP